MGELSGMRCAVLGAGGFLGTNLCLALKGSVANLRGFGRRQSFPGALRGVEWVEGDFTDTTSLATAISGCDVVFHLVNATTPASANIDKVADLEINVVGTLRLLEACRAEGVKRIVFVSSGGTVYGIPSQIPTPENAATAPITAYGISKLSIERYLALYEYLHGLEYRVLRLANPYGQYQTALKSQGVIAAFLRQVSRNEPIEIWGDGTVVRDYVYVDDVTQALRKAAIHSGPSRIFNIGSGHGKSLNEIVESINSVLKVSPTVVFRRGRSVDVPVSVLDTTLAQMELAWTPRIGFEDGLSRTWDWIQKQQGSDQ
jgi:UDP-glucose 4-epimerase